MGHNYRFQYVNNAVSADLAKRQCVPFKAKFPSFEYSSQSHSAEDETASLFISSSAVPARSCYAHINDEDNSFRVIPNLLTRSLCRPFSQFDADDHDDNILSINSPERRAGSHLVKFQTHENI